MKKVLYMHTGSGNHGCEAIIRSTSKLLNGPKDLILWSGTKSEDVKYGADQGFERIVESEELKRVSIPYFQAQFRKRLLHETDAMLKVFLKETFRNTIAISVGGDSYCYEYSARQNIDFAKTIRKYCKANVLWGCSIDSDVLTPELREHLAGYDLITARECLTYQLLKNINPKTMKVADPAFLLERVELPLPDGFIEGNTVGINVSPLIMKYGTDSLILQNYENLIRYIISETDMNICFIPHVIWNYNNDMKPIQHLFDMFADSGRICKIEDGNATVLKGYISRCRFFVGARTHATIAAYSSFVPTLVVGYSIKSRGIARDLFGQEDGYVLSVQTLREPLELTSSFKYILEQEKQIKETLIDVIPSYQEECRRAVACLNEMTES